MRSADPVETSPTRCAPTAHRAGALLVRDKEEYRVDEADKAVLTVLYGGLNEHLAEYAHWPAKRQQPLARIKTKTRAQFLRIQLCGSEI
ncbi:MAG: hypothetical protein WBD41_11975 [Rhodococcus sp. (in: high G+C Gram-positive bacteria)]